MLRSTIVRVIGSSHTSKDHDSRWPRRVYREGSEPDARFSLANERTFLSWIRTSLSFLAAGIALRALNLPIEHHLQTAAAIVLVVVALVSPIQAWIGWMGTERAIRSDRPLPAPRGSSVVVLGVTLVALLVLVGLAWH